MVVSPVLSRVLIREFSCFTLQVFFMRRIRQGWIGDLRRAAISALNQMSRADSVRSDCGNVFRAVDLAADRHKPEFARLGSLRKEMNRDFLQSLPLLFAGLLITIDVIEIT